METYMNAVLLDLRTERSYGIVDRRRRNIERESQLGRTREYLKEIGFGIIGIDELKEDLAHQGTITSSQLRTCYAQADMLDRAPMELSWMESLLLSSDFGRDFLHWPNKTFELHRTEEVRSLGDASELSVEVSRFFSGDWGLLYDSYGPVNILKGQFLYEIPIVRGNV